MLVTSSDISNLEPWLRVALAEWHQLNSDRFPGVPDWSHEAQWMSAEEAVLVGRIRSIEGERQAVLLELERRERGDRDKLARVRTSADAYERALITMQGDGLKDAVVRAFSDLGFQVIDQDENQPSDQHLEDLRLSDPDDPDWVALVEVKGYKRGAKTEAMTQFLRFQRRYMLEARRPPDALWYVVNQFLGRDPASRQPVLHGQDEDVSVFAESGGLIVDTVVLFNLLRQVQDGKLDRAELRARLRGSTGRLDLEAREDRD